MKNMGVEKRYAVRFTSVVANKRLSKKIFLLEDRKKLKTDWGGKQEYKIKVLGNPDVAPTKIQYIKESILSLSHKHLC